MIVRFKSPVLNVLFYLPAYLLVFLLNGADMVSGRLSGVLALGIYYAGAWDYIDDAIWYLVIYGDVWFDQ